MCSSMLLQSRPAASLARCAESTHRPAAPCGAGRRLRRDTDPHECTRVSGNGPGARWRSAATSCPHQSRASRRWRCRMPTTRRDSRRRAPSPRRRRPRRCVKLSRPPPTRAKSTSGLIAGRYAAAIFCAPLDQHVGQERLGGGIGIAAGSHGRANHVVREAGDPPRRPEGIVGPRARRNAAVATRGRHDSGSKASPSNRPIAGMLRRSRPFATAR